MCVNVGQVCVRRVWAWIRVVRGMPIGSSWQLLLLLRSINRSIHIDMGNTLFDLSPYLPCRFAVCRVGLWGNTVLAVVHILSPPIALSVNHWSHLLLLHPTAHRAQWTGSMWSVRGSIRQFALVLQPHVQHHQDAIRSQLIDYSGSWSYTRKYCWGGSEDCGGRLRLNTMVIKHKAGEWCRLNILCVLACLLESLLLLWSDTRVNNVFGLLWLS